MTGEEKRQRQRAGLLGSLALTRFPQSMLFDIKPSDPTTFAAIAALLAAVTLFACFIPARAG
ncbi:MAG TPA: hypothetical protein VNH65_20625 [Candidatus Acidoferrum sp.]|nr:hypothetical protein [Candidatus Acidoferrum sp.]